MLIENQIVQGECAQIMKCLQPASVDLVITDPPYLVNYRDRSNRSILNDNDPEKVLSSYAEIYRLLKPNSFCISFYGWNKVDYFCNAWRQAGFRPVGHIAWEKDYASNSYYVRYHHEQAYLLAKGNPPKPSNPLRDIQRWEYTGNKIHPTEKAVSIIKPLIETYSEPNDLVLDPFVGSGTTAVAALFAGRRYLGIDLEPKYCRLARKRLAGAAQFRPAPAIGQEQSVPS